MKPTILTYDQIIRGLSKWEPHPGQIRVGKALFTYDIRSLFIQCGRKWGKTEFALYVLWRWAMMYPGLGCYYVAPELKQARKIVWEDPRLEHFGPREWITDINSTDARIRLISGSYIKVDGSDNFDAHRGTRPGIVIYEEYKDHDPRFRNTMRPNLAVYNAPEIFIGSPPDRECEYTITAEEHKDDQNKLFYEAPSWENHHISRDWLKAEKARLYRRGEGDVWEREYGAKYVPGGASKIFPMWDDTFVVPHDELLAEIHRDRNKLLWFHCSDPGTATVFAVLFAALNPYTKQWYLLDEIYEKEQRLMSVRQIGPRIFEKRDDLNEREWDQLYDEAALWYANEMLDNYDEAFIPTHKHLNDKDSGLTLIKDIMLARKMKVSDRCKHFFSEVDGYYKDKNGKIPKKNDHLIDDFRYIIGHANYHLRPEDEPKPSNSFDEEQRRGYRISDDYDGHDDMGGIDDDLSETIEYDEED